MKEVFHRRSIRKYLDIPVASIHIDKILRAAMAAPSARNQKPWEYYVVTNKEKLEQLSTCSEYAKMVAQAPLCFVACRRTQNLNSPHFSMIDMAASVENMLLEIDHCGLGACWIGICPVQERMDNVARVLELPASLEAFALIPCGYPNQEIASRDNFEEARVHYID